MGRTPLTPGPVSLLIREARLLPASAAAQHQLQAVQSEDKLLRFSVSLTWTAKGPMPCSRAPCFLVKATENELETGSTAHLPTRDPCSFGVKLASSLNSWCLVHVSLFNVDSFIRNDFNLFQCLVPCAKGHSELERHVMQKIKITNMRLNGFCGNRSGNSKPKAACNEL